MHESHGELLIGGDTLHHVHVELEQEIREPEAWLLSGRIRISPQQAEILELHRHYLLQLDDGRAGPIALTRLEPHEGVLLALFQPDVRRPRN